jgi:pyridoxal phosphate enzyme (YggS family)
MKEHYRHNLNTLFEQIEQSRVQYSPHHIVKVVAVSKYSNADEIRAMYEAGQRAFGENKIQDLLKKQEALSDLPIEWHFIGRIQTNKINHLIDANVALIHSIDSLKTAEELDKRLKVKGKKVNALLQINSANEASKAGISPNEALETYSKINKTYDSISLQGLMSIGAHTDNIDTIHKSFETTKKLFDDLEVGGMQNASILSMGMSSDYSVAITVGANLIRVGSTLFKQ